MQSIHPIFSHSGFEKLYVADKERAKMGDFFHQLHHRYFECNYGTVEMPWDRWFGSFHDGTEAATIETRALAIENAQKAYDDALKSYNEGVDQESELAKAKEELDELKLSAQSETFSPTNAYAIGFQTVKNKSQRKSCQSNQCQALVSMTPANFRIQHFHQR